MRRSSLPKPVRDGLAIGAIILVIAALVGFAGAPRILAASAPTPAASYFYTIQAWLDREPPMDAAPGSTVRIGVTLWDRAAEERAPNHVVAVSTTRDNRAPLERPIPALPPLSVGLAATAGGRGRVSGQLLRRLWR